VSRIVLGVGASHSTLMNTHWHEVEGVDRAVRFRTALSEANEMLRAVAPDAVVVVGSNHFRGLWLDLMPAFTLGVGDCVASGESGTPSGALRVDVGLARHLCRTLVGDGFDLAFSAKLQVDHGVSHAIQYVLAGVDAPIVPLLVNVFAPPRPSLARCRALGAALGAAVTTDSADKRVVVIGSGGLSHQLPFPDWEAPVTDDDRFLVDAWTSGRDSWRQHDPRRREITRAATPRVSEGFDRELLELLEHGDLAALTTLSDQQLEEAGGNGAHEIRSWLVMAAACGDAPGRALVYSPMPEWLTGMAVGVIEPPADEAQDEEQA
jgi:2,3-dihydroxyphenylpropionate 1,2-dioxygenase